MVSIYIKFKELILKMLHTKFRGNWQGGWGQKDMLIIFTIYGHGSHLDHVHTLSLTFCQEAAYEI